MCFAGFMMLIASLGKTEQTASGTGWAWRQFTLSEMVMPCAILISVGIACFAIGTRGLNEA